MADRYRIRRSDGAYFMGSDLQGRWFGPVAYAGEWLARGAAEQTCEELDRDEADPAKGLSGRTHAVEVVPELIGEPPLRSIDGTVID